ncbi:hypothetical protein GGF38_002175, partial [Coemansia sp. RSA 25]
QQSQQQLAEQKAEDSEVARRVRCGERLRELFGPWHAHEAEEQAHDDLGASLGGNSRRGSQPDTSSRHTAAAAAVPQAPPPSAAAPTMAGGGLEGCTYLYSRASLPNIVMVAVLLDTERGLARRREAERAWDDIVDAVRGTSMFERLMSLPS